LLLQDSTANASTNKSRIIMVCPPLKPQGSGCLGCVFLGQFFLVCFPAWTPTGMPPPNPGK
jgi:hypothetical protein